MNKLHINNRKNITEKVAKIIKSNNSFFLEGKPGLGKTKYVKYIFFDEEAKNYWFPGVDFKYVNIQRIINNSIIEEENIEIQIKKELNKIIENRKNKEIPIYLILDNVDDIKKNTSIEYIKDIRNEYKYSVNFIFITRNFSKLNKIIWEYILNFSPIAIKLKPFTKEEIIEDLKNIEGNLGVKFTEKEIDIIVKYSKGIPKNIKFFTTYKIADYNIEEVLEEFLSRNASTKDFLNTLTATELKFFKKFQKNKGEVIKKQTLAEIINPTLEGAGVSNTAIDQTIKRLRKKIKDNNYPIKIATKRGIGYILEEI